MYTLFLLCESPRGMTMTPGRQWRGQRFREPCTGLEKFALEPQLLVMVTSVLVFYRLYFTNRTHAPCKNIQTTEIFKVCKAKVAGPASPEGGPQGGDHPPGSLPGTHTENCLFERKLGHTLCIVLRDSASFILKWKWCGVGSKRRRSEERRVGKEV